MLMLASVVSRRPSHAHRQRSRSIGLVAAMFFTLYEGPADAKKVLRTEEYSRQSHAEA